MAAEDLLPLRCGQPLISEATVFSSGPSAAPQLTDVVGVAGGGLHPHPAEITPTVRSTAIKPEIRITGAYGRRGAIQRRSASAVLSGAVLKPQPDPRRGLMQDVHDALEELGVLGDHPDAAADHCQPKRCAIEGVSNQLFGDVRRRADLAEHDVEPRLVQRRIASFDPRA